MPNTNYPGSIDSPTDPTAGETLAAGGHTALHTFLNAAVVAIENALGVNLSKVARIGDPSRVTTPITYTDPVTGDAILVNTFTEDATALAFGIAGEAYPELLIRPDTDEGSNTAVFFGDGTFDPYTGPHGHPYGVGLLNGSLYFGGGGDTSDASDTYGFLGYTNGNVHGTNYLNGQALAVGAATTSDIGNIMFSKGDPNSLNVPGNLCDVCWNLNSTSASDWLYKCTTAGIAGSAVWTAFTGGGAVSSVAAADGTLTITPTTGAVTAKIPSNVALPGAPTTTTATTADNTTKIATTAFVQSNAGLLVPKSLVTTKGDLIAASASATPARLGVGSDKQVLIADSTQTLGMRWGVPPGLNFGAEQTTSFSALGNTFYPIDTTSGAVTCTLPTTPSDGTTIALKIVAPTPLVNLATVTTGGSDVLNLAGTTSTTIKVTGEAQVWVYNASTSIWYAESSTPVGQLDARYGYSGTSQSLTPSTSGTAVITQYWTGPLKTYVLVLSAWHDAGQTITFTTAFTADVPGYMSTPGIPTAMNPTSGNVTKTTFVLPTTGSAAITGVYVIQGV